MDFFSLFVGQLLTELLTREEFVLRSLCRDVARLAGGIQCGIHLFTPR